MSILRSGRAARTTSTTMTALLTMGLATATAGTSWGAPMRQAASPWSANRAILLDATGKPIAMPRQGQAFPAGVTPTYVAYRLNPRQAVPSGTPTIPVTPARGGVGPLRLDAAALQSINAGLASSSEIAVTEPRQKFLLERATTDALSDPSTQFWRAVVGDAQSGADQVGQAVKSAYDTSKKAVQNLDDQIVKLLKNTFIAPEAPKPVIAGGMPPSSTKIKAAARVLGRPTADAATTTTVHVAAQEVAVPQAAPVPEPSAWLVFAAATALGLRLRSRKGK